MGILWWCSNTMQILVWYRERYKAILQWEDILVEYPTDQLASRQAMLSGLTLGCSQHYRDILARAKSAYKPSTIGYRWVCIKASANSFKCFTSPTSFLKLSFSLYAPTCITSDECHAWFHLNAVSQAAWKMVQVPWS